MNLRRNRGRQLRRTVAALLMVATAAGVGWLAQRYHRAFDWSSSQRNTLDAASRKLLDSMPGPVQITAFVSPNPRLHRGIAALINRYHRYKHDLVLKFVDPAHAPEQARKLGVPSGGALVLTYGGRHETLQVLDEQHLTNALLRVAGSPDRWIVFISGHGERDPHGKANYDLGQFAGELKQRGLHVQTLDLTKTPVIPDNTSVVVIAAPQKALDTKEVDVLRVWVAGGGDVLWLGEPGGQKGLAALARDLGVDFLPGVVLSTRSATLGLRNPAFIVVDHYTKDDPVTRGLVKPTLLPVVVGLAPRKDSGWQARAFLRSSEHSWSESGDLKKGPVRFDSGTADRRGPIDLGLELQRPSPNGGEQRVAVTGDSDFLANAYLAKGANLDLGVNLVHWLAHDDRFINIPPWRAPDAHLELTDTLSAVIAFGFPFGVPVLLIGAGALVRYRRGRRR